MNREIAKLAAHAVCACAKLYLRSPDVGLKIKINFSCAVQPLLAVDLITQVRSGHTVLRKMPALFGPGERSRCYSNMSKMLLFGLLFLSQASTFTLNDKNIPPNLKVRDTNSFPMIYVGQGLVDCGAPLIKDQCSTYPVNYSITTGQQTFAVHASDLYSISTTFSIVAGNPTIIPINGYVALQGTFQITVTHDPPATRVVVATSYTPTISHVLTAAPVSSPQPQTTAAPNIPRNIQPIRKRDFGYDICQGQPPSWRILTNSLTEVCHFVANAKNYFVSLKPSSDAAYLPSWTSYLFQSFLCVMYFFCIVCSPEINYV